MSATVDDVRSDMLALPEAERTRLIFDLLDSIDLRPVEDDDIELDSVWADETARRAEQLDANEVATDSWDDVRAKVADASRAG